MKNLINIQNELKVPKGNFNSFGKYKYRSSGEILEAVKPILLKHEATLTLTDEVLPVGDKIFLKATARLVVGGENVEVCGFAETSEHKGMSAEQTTGTASSYARKYALNGLFLIDETEADADGQNGGNNQSRPPTQSKPKTPPVKEIPAVTAQELAWRSQIISISKNLNKDPHPTLNYYDSAIPEDRERCYRKIQRTAILSVISSENWGLTPEGTIDYLAKFGIAGVNDASGEALDKCYQDFKECGYL